MSFQSKRFKKKKNPLCLRNISGNFFANNVKKLVSNECVYGFSVDYSTFILTYLYPSVLNKKHNVK